MIKIDLHTLRHKNIRSFLIRKIEMYWDRDEVLEIITGHSNKMKSIVIKLLDEYHLNYKIGGNIGINNGMIRVDMK